jgi:phosphate acetyltransferase
MAKFNFLENVKNLNKSNPGSIVFPEGFDERIQQASLKLLKQGLMNKVFILGKKEDVLKTKELEEFLNNKLEIIDSQDESGKYFKDFTETYFELRKHKGIDLDQAKTLIKDHNNFGAMLVKKNMADGMVSGSSCPTGDVLRSAFTIVGKKPGVSLVSSAFIMILSDDEYGKEGHLVFADCAVNPNPNAQELSEIAIESGKTAKALLDMEPRIAMLSFSTNGSAQHELVDKVREATKLARDRSNDILIDGEMQLDAALVEKIGKKKFPGSNVAGNANVLIFPDLQAGNIGYKLVQRLSGAEAIGPVMQGIAKPVNDLSRGCSSDDIFYLAMITILQTRG